MKHFVLNGIKLLPTLSGLLMDNGEPKRRFLPELLNGNCFTIPSADLTVTSTVRPSTTSLQCLASKEYIFLFYSSLLSARESNDDEQKDCV